MPGHGIVTVIVLFVVQFREGDAEGVKMGVEIVEVMVVLWQVCDVDGEGDGYGIVTVVVVFVQFRDEVNDTVASEE